MCVKTNPVLGVSFRIIRSSELLFVHDGNEIDFKPKQ